MARAPERRGRAASDGGGRLGEESEVRIGLAGARRRAVANRWSAVQVRERSPNVGAILVGLRLARARGLLRMVFASTRFRVTVSAVSERVIGYGFPS
jgi:hypothetical protein